MGKNENIIRLCINKGGKTYQVSSLYLLSDGSFKIDVPYCEHEDGVVMTLPHAQPYTDKNGKALIPLNESKQVFHLNGRPQLSVHRSGLVQFSGSNILSGIDPASGEAKGAAIQSKPLDTPITTGPTCGVMMWGIEKGYKEMRGSKSNFVIYKENDFVRMGNLAEDFNSFQFDFFVVRPPSRPTRNRFTDADGAEFATFRFEFYAGYILTMRLFKLLNTDLFVGVIPIMRNSRWAKDTPFGFYLSSPQGYIGKDKSHLYSIHAFSPFVDFGGHFTPELLPSLDFKRKDESL